METNGPANIVMALDCLSDEAWTQADDGQCSVLMVDSEVDKIKKEAYMTINYMKEIAEVLKKHGLENEIPMWHEVKEKYNV